MIYSILVAYISVTQCDTWFWFVVHTTDRLRVYLCSTPDLFGSSLSGDDVSPDDFPTIYSNCFTGYLLAQQVDNIMIIITLKVATPSEQYVDWDNTINFIFMRGQNLPPLLNNMSIGVITSTISPWGIKICHPLSSWGIDIHHPLWTICWLG